MVGHDEGMTGSPDAIDVDQESIERFSARARGNAGVAEGDVDDLRRAALDLAGRRIHPAAEF